MRGLRVAILFVLVLFAGDRAGAWTIGKILDQSRDPIARLYGGRGAADVVLLGNSRAYYTFDLDALAQNFGGSVLNLALPGVPTTVSAALFADYVDRYGPPRVAILEVSGLPTSQGAVTQLRPFALKSSRLAGLLRLHAPKYYYGGLLTHLLNYDSDDFLNLAHKVFFAVPKLVLDGTLGPERAAAAHAEAPPFFAVRNENELALRAIVATAERSGADLRLVVAPVIPGYARANEIAAMVDASARAAGSRKIWDFSLGPIVDPSMFHDYVHLNRAGVSTFARVLEGSGFFANP